MKSRIALLVAVAGLCSSAVADHPIALPGPLLATGAAGTTVVQDLSGATIPAGTYRSFVLTGDWGNQTGNAFSSEALTALINQNVIAGATFHADPGVGFGSFDDNFAQVGIRWEATMDIDYVGGNPLFLTFLQADPATTAEWTNIALDLKNAGAGPNPTPDLTVPAFNFPAGGSPFFTSQQTITLANQGDIKWVKITTNAPITTLNNQFLDIDTETSTLAPTNDTVIAMYDTNGVLIAGDDDDGTALLSLLSFGGVGLLALPSPTGAPYIGQDGELPAGDYFIAVFGTGDGETSPVSRFYNGRNVLLSAAGTSTGDVKLNFRTGTVVPATCTINEVEPNDTKPTSQIVNMAANDVLCGTTTGTAGAGLTSRDYFRVRGPIPAAGQIFRNRLAYSSATPGNSQSVRGLVVSAAGVVTPGSDQLLQQLTPANVTPAASFTWYSLGTNPTADANAYRVVFRVAGTAATTAQYKYAMLVEPVTPIEAGASFLPGQITVSSDGVTATDTDMWIYDGNLNPISDAGNDDVSATVFQSTVARTYDPGTYYAAISRFNLCNNIPSPATDAFRGGQILDHPGVIMNSQVNPQTGAYFNSPIPTDVSITITDSSGTPRLVQAQQTTQEEVMFIKFVVAAAGNGGCQPADIADDTGAPLPSAGSNTGVNEGDYNAFFAGFFDALAYCDQWDDAGNPLPTAGVNSGVNEGDYNGFFATFFNGCP